MGRSEGPIRLEHFPGIAQPLRAQRMAGRVASGPQAVVANKGGTGHNFLSFVKQFWVYTNSGKTTKKPGFFGRSRVIE
jgi:hypothetical protein